MYIIAPYVQIALYKDGGIVGVGSRQEILPYQLWSAVLKALSDIKKKRLYNQRELPTALLF